MKQNTKPYLLDGVKGLCAGFIIGMMAWLYVVVNDGTILSKTVGAILFSLALILICVLNLNLFTSRVGYLVDENKTYIFKVLTIVLSNVIGVLIVGLLAILVNQGEAGFATTFNAHAQTIMDAKLIEPWYATIILALFCGVLMHLAGYVYKNAQSNLFKIAVIIFAVMTFLLAGFEHSIANIFYYTVAYKPEVFAHFGLVVLGNVIGGLLIEVLLNIIKNGRFLTYKKRCEQEAQQAAEAETPQP